MSGLTAPAFFRAIAASLALASGFALAPVSAQQVQSPTASVQPPASVRPVPGALELSKLVWSTILAVDHANQSGNYSVLRDMSAQGFQINNNAANLANVFSGIRNAKIDLSNALLVPPTYLEAPRQIQPEVFEVKGQFNLRPTSIYFDMYFQWEQGRWKLFGIDIQPIAMVDSMPPPKK